MVKDRLLELQNMASGKTKQKNKFIETEDTSTETTPLTIDEFTKQINEIQSTIESIDDKIKDLKKFYQTVLTSTNKNETIDKQIEQCSHEITNLMSRSRKQLENLRFHVGSNEKNVNETRMKLKKNQLDVVTRMFVETKKEYDKVNDEYKKTIKEKLTRHLEIVGKKVNEDEIDDMIEEGNLNAFNEDVILETKRLRQTLKDVEERHNEFIQIEKKIEEIRDMMSELFSIVYDQGHKITDIQKKTDEGVEDAEKGRKNITEAIKKKKKAEKFRCYLIVFVVIIVIIILITITLSILKSLR